MLRSLSWVPRGLPTPWCRGEFRAGPAVRVPVGNLGGGVRRDRQCRRDALRRHVRGRVESDRIWLKVALHGTVGGITSVLGGGKFGHGFAAAGFTALGTSFNNSNYIGRRGFSPLRVAIGATIGGTASRLTGGKFANGAITGAFSQALNAEAREMNEQRIGRVRPHQGGLVDGPNTPDGRFSPDGEFRQRVDGTPRPHLGIDLAGNVGDPIVAAADGVVELVCPATQCTRSGNQVTIEHADGTFSRYFHLNTIDVQQGQTVSAGQTIGTLGTTGNAAGTQHPHVHFEVREGHTEGEAIDPEEWLGR